MTESAFVASWFKGKELSLALGIDLCVSRIFAAINDVSQPAFYVSSGHKLSMGFWFGFILCLVSMACAVALIMIDIKADKGYVIQIEVPAGTGPTDAELEAAEKEEEDDVEDVVKIADFKKLPKTFWLLTGNCVFIYMSFMSFMNVASDMLQARFGYSFEAAGIVLVSLLRSDRVQ